MRIVISDPKTGKSYQAELPAEKESSLVGLKIGDAMEGALVGAAGYKMQITGGSDKEGFPMRSDVSGTRRIRILIAGKPGFRAKEHGIRKRKAVRGNVVSDAIAQLNTIITEAGATPLEQIFPPKPKKEGEKKEEKGKGGKKAKK
ncbi:MAG: 30S ribosomal protein S6e [Candidatus Micrarchaeota archaeon]